MRLQVAGDQHTIVPGARSASDIALHHSCAPHTAFGGLPAAAGAFAARVLSSHQDGAATLFVSLHSESELKTPSIRLRAAVDVFVLEGEFQHGSDMLRKHSFARFPAGVCIGACSVSPGTSFLWLQKSGFPLDGSGGEIFEAADTSAEGCDFASYIPVKDAPSMAWSCTLTPGYPTGAMRKSLTSDCWLLGVLPHFGSPNRKSHACSQENFMLSGSVHATGLGVLDEGCYRYTPPHVTYGPNSVPDGCMMFVSVAMGVLKSQTVRPLE